jgi:uncharacterized membrane protein YbaN (DUF454 family)
MLRKLLIVIAGSALAVSGLIGLILPIIPGVLLLAAAAFCFSMVSPTVHQMLHTTLGRHPRWRLAQQRWRAGRSLSPARRAALAFWLTAGSLLPASRR